MTTSINSPVVQISEPSILSANTYFWSSGSSASQRRSSESRNINNVAEYFRSIGLNVTVSCDTVTGTNDSIEATFFYSESCANVYKTLSIYRNSKKSNISAIRKLATSI